MANFIWGTVRKQHVSGRQSDSASVGNMCLDLDAGSMLHVLQFLRSRFRRRGGSILMPVNQKTMQAVQTVQTLIQSPTINFQIVLDLCILDMRYGIREMIFSKWFPSFRPGVNQLWFEVFLATLGSFTPVCSVRVDRCN